MGCSLSKEDLTQGEGGNIIQLEAWEKKEKESVRYAIESEVKYDPWGEYDQKGKVSAAPTQDLKEKNVSIVDLRTNHDGIKNARDVKSAVKNSEAQTDSAEGVDFDWDLTDKTDIETQVNKGFLLNVCTYHLNPLRPHPPPEMDIPTSPRMQLCKQISGLFSLEPITGHCQKRRSCLIWMKQRKCLSNTTGAKLGGRCMIKKFK